jgi:hypothetical protein
VKYVQIDWTVITGLAKENETACTGTMGRRIVTVLVKATETPRQDSQTRSSGTSDNDDDGVTEQCSPSGSQCREDHSLETAVNKTRRMLRRLTFASTSKLLLSQMSSSMRGCMECFSFRGGARRCIALADMQHSLISLTASI